jgi:uncharacterized protein (TIGR02118 family)
MIKVSGMYANQDGNRFDIDYYCTKHVPRVGELLGTALSQHGGRRRSRGYDAGLARTVSCHGPSIFRFRRPFQGAFMPHVAPLLADIPNFTNCQPTV